MSYPRPDDRVDDQFEESVRVERPGRTLLGLAPTRALRFEALASGFVAILALLLSAYTVYVQRQQLKVQAWPRLTVVNDSQLGSSPGEAHFTFSLKNRGVAPTEVRAVRVGFDGEDVKTWKEYFTRVTRKHGLKGGLSLSKVGSPNGEILGVGEQYVLLAGDSARTAAVLTEGSDETSMSFCYCSVLEDCWVLDLPVNDGDPTTTSVSRCPTYPTKFVGWPAGAGKEWAESILDAGLEADAPSDGPAGAHDAK